MSNLRLLNETLVTSTVSSVSLTNLFSENFDTYKMTLVYDHSAGNVLRTQMINSAGSVVTDTNYDWSTYQLRAGGSFQHQRGQSDDEWRMSYEGTEGWNVTTYFFNPFSSSKYTFYLTQSSGYYGGAGLGHLGIKGIGVLKQTASMTGLKFTGVGSSIDSLSCRIYGLRVDT